MVIFIVEYAEEFRFARPRDAKSLKLSRFMPELALTIRGEYLKGIFERMPQYQLKPWISQGAFWPFDGNHD
jgi:hypothetical protein